MIIRSSMLGLGQTVPLMQSTGECPPGTFQIAGVIAQSACSPTLPITPSDITAPGLPIGYNLATGAVSSLNSGGTTLVANTPSTSTPGVLASSVQSNIAEQAACAAGGGSWDDVNGCVTGSLSDTTTTGTDYTGYYIAAGIVAIAIVLFTMNRQKR